jgi:hypothetical protein
MRIPRDFGSSARLIRWAIAVALILPLLWGVAAAYQRHSPSLAISIDTFSNGGGPAASFSYRQLDSAVGQESVCGLATGTAIRDQSGVIQPWGNDRNAANAWNHY